MRSNALLALAQFGREALAALPGLVATLSDERPDVRALAAATLGEIGPDAKDAVPKLIGVLNEQNTHVCLHAAGAVWKIDRRSDLAVPVLIELVGGSERSEIRCESAKLLGEIGPDAKPALPILSTVLEGTDRSLAVAGQGQTVIFSLLTRLC